MSVEATPANIAAAIIELLVQRGVRTVHVDEKTGTADALTGALIDPPLLSKRDLALGKHRWWAAEWPLKPHMGVPSDLANRRNAQFFWAYDSIDNPTMMRFLVRDPPRPTNAELSDEVSRRFNIMQEKTIPALYRSYATLETRVKRMEDMWTKAPELVYRPQEDDIIFCSHNRLNAPPEPVYRVEEQEKREELEEEAFKRLKEKDHANNALLLSLVEYLKKVDVRLTVLEEKQEDRLKLWNAMSHLQQQMTQIFAHLKIKTLDPKDQKKPGPPHGVPPGGKLPVKAKAKAASKEEAPV